MNTKKAAIIGFIYGLLYVLFCYIVVPSSLMRVPGKVYYLPPEIAEFLIWFIYIFAPLGIFYIPLTSLFNYYEPLLAPLFGALLGVIVYKVYTAIKG